MDEAFEAGTAESNPDTSAPNLFQSLFNYRPRIEFKRSNENYLTGALSYFLQKDPALLRRFVALTAPEHHVARDLSVSSQVVFPTSSDTSTRRCIPDIAIEGISAAGDRVELWVENKWGSAFSEDQLRRYSAELKSRRPNRGRCCLTFMSPNRSELRKAQRFGEQNRSKTMFYSSVSWAQVHDLLETSSEPALANELRSFMRAHGLGPIEKITIGRAQVPKIKGTRKSALRSDLAVICENVLSELKAEWRAFDDGRVHDGWGRVAIWDESYKLSFGIMYEPGDHRIGYLDAARPLDVLIRVQANPTDADLEVERKKLRPLAVSLEKIGYDCNPDHGSWQKTHTQDSSVD